MSRRRRRLLRTGGRVSKHAPLPVQPRFARHRQFIHIPQPRAAPPSGCLRNKIEVATGVGRMQSASLAIARSVVASGRSRREEGHHRTEGTAAKAADCIRPTSLPLIRRRFATLDHEMRTIVFGCEEPPVFFGRSVWKKLEMVPAHLAEVENPHISRLTHNRQWQTDEGLQGSIDHERCTGRHLLASLHTRPTAHAATGACAGS